MAASSAESEAEQPEGDGTTATEAYGFVGWITSAVCYGASFCPAYTLQRPEIRTFLAE